MREILFGYKLDPTTWAYISALMMIGIYFKFRRFWSVRNLDLVGLICFSPGLLLVYHGLPMQHGTRTRSAAARGRRIGPGGLRLAVRRQRLLPDPPAARPGDGPPTAVGAEPLGQRPDVYGRLPAGVSDGQRHHQPEGAAGIRVGQTGRRSRQQSPGYEWFYKFAGFANEAMVSAEPDAVATRSHREAMILAATTRTAAILAHLAIVAGMVWLGYRHFDNIHTGVAAATLYLLTFYTSQLTSHVDHVVPAALLVWVVAAYRLPLLSGVLLGLAAGLIYYPLFLLPLWCSFYWRRGLVRFVCGVLLAMALLAASLALNWHDLATFLTRSADDRLAQSARRRAISGFWKYYDPSYRIPVLALFVAICGGMAIWPAQKNLGTLLSCSAAVMLATQFWHAHEGGLCMAWYLPLLILTIFRPNLEDRVAMSAVRPGWGRRKKEVRVDAAAG